MSDFLDVVTAYPVIVFTVLAITSTAYWVISSLLGFADSVVEIDADLDAGGDSSNSFAEFLGVDSAPLSIFITLLSFAGLLISVILSVAFDNKLSFIAATIILFVSFLIAGLIAKKLAKYIAPFFEEQNATSHDELIGRICVIQTGKANSTFGQAEVSGPQGGSHLIQVRIVEKLELEAGDKALLVDVNKDGIFKASADIGVIEDLDF